MGFQGLRTGDSTIGHSASTLALWHGSMQGPGLVSSTLPRTISHPHHPCSCSSMSEQCNSPGCSGLRLWWTFSETPVFPSHAMHTTHQPTSSAPSSKYVQDSTSAFYSIAEVQDAVISGLGCGLLPFALGSPRSN